MGQNIDSYFYCWFVKNHLSGHIKFTAETMPSLLIMAIKCLCLSGSLAVLMLGLFVQCI